MATITKTISKNATLGADSDTIQGAFDLCLDDGNDYDLQILDLATYTEQAALAARPAGGTVTLRSTAFYRDNRPTVTISGVDGALITARASIIVKGIHFSYEENTYGSDYRYCIYVPSAVAKVNVSHCVISMGGRYFWTPGTEYGHVGIWTVWNCTEVKVWNNIIRRCGFIGVRVDPSGSDTVEIYNNTFVKCQECIWIETFTDQRVSVWNNIFTMDPDWSVDCTKFYVIWAEDNQPLTRLKRLDYNCYDWRNTGLALETWAYDQKNHSYRKSRLADVQGLGLEANGIEVAAEYCTYCSDYHLKPASPCVNASDTATDPSDDADGVARGDAIGAYVGLCGATPQAGVQFDAKQNDTYWYRMTCQNSKRRTGLDTERNRVVLDTVRIL